MAKKVQSKIKTITKIMLWCGYLVFGWGLLHVILGSASSSHHLDFSNFGVVLGLGAHMIIGLFAILVANGLMEVEKRLDQLEKMK